MYLFYHKTFIFANINGHAYTKRYLKTTSSLLRGVSRELVCSDVTMENISQYFSETYCNYNGYFVFAQGPFFRARFAFSELYGAIIQGQTSTLEESVYFAIQRTEQPRPFIVRSAFSTSELVIFKECAVFSAKIVEDQ